MRTEVYRPEEHRQIWEDFLGQRARNAHFIHTHSYLGHHVDRFDHHSLPVYEEKNPQPLAVLPANRNGSVLVSHGGLSFGGRLVGERFRLGDWRDAFGAIGKRLGKSGFEELGYRPTWYHPIPGEEEAFLIESAG